ncbi:Homocysteine S-methyltransferase [Dacryopinax primogenitus]|uniref:Homocysteine S-methyltransferase n=1 Tax=Dacryopinax primogenitus (strain DJM 731) TaxID=1858805 RepID=M5G723_DACPD|nr:Homocysteine S-methyltransferase [Dacryopinax primogenitus]EJU04524.1 Homocysteine S-methyltransferase [Dacryopinax primogenitus]
MLETPIPCLILDGGLGTTIEELDEQVTHHPLWSGKLLHDNPELLVDTHLRFLEAGADVIETATYQSCLPTFVRAGYEQEEAQASILSAITLAEEAIRRFEQSSGTHRRPLVALSLGPYGAQITQEYGGIYPPPYGPSIGANILPAPETSFASPEEEVLAELALTQWHFDRLLLFATSPSHWNSISYIAFETIPLLREGRAIRRAMTRLRPMAEARGLIWPKWWISFVFPEGKFPEVKTSGEPILPQDIANAMFDAEDERRNILIPDGIGANCTKLQFLKPIIIGYGEGLHRSSKGRPPELVLYPDGGYHYDTNEGAWQAPHLNRDGTERRADGVLEPWARSVARIGAWGAQMTYAGRPMWSALIVGGCCKTLPLDIAALKREYGNHVY